jgi:hypothetical protein
MDTSDTARHTAARRARLPLALVLATSLLAGLIALGSGGTAGAQADDAGRSAAPTPGGVVPPGLAWQPDGPCQGFIVVADIGKEHPRCSTGPEVFPEVKAGTKLADVPSNPLPCEGNGTDGFRIQVAYVHQGSSDRATATDLANIRAVTLQANDALVATARASGARRNFRFVTKGCQLDILDAQVSASDSDRVYDALRQSARFTRLDRVYLVYVSPRFSHRAGVGGETYSYRDDSPVASRNINTYGGNMARIYTWSQVTVAHELGHAMGSVMPAAPGATTNGHCWDGGSAHNPGADIMCYDDGGIPPGRTQVDLCAGDAGRPVHYFDCNKDTYFNVNPRPGSYLATHWNIARSLYMTSAVVDPARAFPAVDDGFSAILGRRADDAGRLFWASRSFAGANPREIIVSLTATAESRRRNGLAGKDADPGQWVKAIYRNALCRQPDAAGLAYWTSLTRQKGVDYTAAILAGSAEGRRRQAAAPGPGARICPGT